MRGDGRRFTVSFVGSCELLASGSCAARAHGGRSAHSAPGRARRWCLLRTERCETRPPVYLGVDWASIGLAAGRACYCRALRKNHTPSARVTTTNATAPAISPAPLLLLPLTRDTIWLIIQLAESTQVTTAAISHPVFIAVFLLPQSDEVCRLTASDESETRAFASTICKAYRLVDRISSRICVSGRRKGTRLLPRLRLREGAAVRQPYSPS